MVPLGSPCVWIAQPILMHTVLARDRLLRNADDHMYQRIQAWNRSARRYSITIRRTTVVCFKAVLPFVRQNDFLLTGAEALVWPER